MSMEKENLSEGDVLKGADDAAARIRAKRAAKAAGAKEEKIEIKFPELPTAPAMSEEERNAFLKIADGLPVAQKEKPNDQIGESTNAPKLKEELGIENKILEGEAKPAPAPEKTEIQAPQAAVSGAEAGSEDVSLKNELELEQAADAGGKKKELTEEERQKKVEKLEEIERERKVLRKKIDVVIQEIESQTTEKSSVVTVSPPEIAPSATAKTVAPEAITPAPKAEELIPETEEERKVAEEIEAMSPQKKKQFGRGVANFGYLTRKWKAKALSGALNAAAKKLKDKIHFIDKEGRVWTREAKTEESNVLHRFLSSYGKIYDKEAKDAEKKIKQIEMGKIQRASGTGLLVGNALKFGRILSDINYANPFRHFMAAAMFIGRSSEAAKEARLKNEKVIAGTRIDYNAAYEEAWNLHELARENPFIRKSSAENLENTYKEFLVKEDILNRLEVMERKGGLTGFARNVIQDIAGGDIVISVRHIQRKLKKIDEDDELINEEKDRETKIVLKKYEKFLGDLDRIITQAGTVDLVSYGARLAETSAKTVTYALMLETVAMLTVKIAETMHELEFGEGIKSLAGKLSKKISSIRGKEEPRLGGPTEERGGRVPETEERRQEVPETKERGELGKEQLKILEELKQKNLKELQKENFEELERLRKEEGEKSGGLFELRKAWGGQWVDKYNLLPKPDKIKFQEKLAQIYSNPPEDFKKILSSLKTKDEIKEASYRYVFEKKWQIPKITGEALSRDEANKAFSGWGENTEVGKMLKIPKNKEIYLKICQGEHFYNGKIGDTAADQWAIYNMSSKSAPPTEIASPPAVSKHATAPEGTSKVAFPQIIGEALTHEKANENLNAWIENLEKDKEGNLSYMAIYRFLSIPKNREICLKIYEGKYSYNGEIGEDAAVNWVSEHVFAPEGTSKPEAAEPPVSSKQPAPPPAPQKPAAPVPEPSPKAKVPEPAPAAPPKEVKPESSAKSTSAQPPEAAKVAPPEAAKAPEPQAAPRPPAGGFEATIQKGGNVWDAARGLIGKGESKITAKQFNEAWSNPKSVVEIIDKNGNTKIIHISNLNLVHAKDEVKFIPGKDGEAARFTVVDYKNDKYKIGEILPEKSEKAAGAPEKSEEVEHNWNRKHYGKTLPPEAETYTEKEGIMGGESKIKRIPRQYPFGGKVVTPETQTPLKGGLAEEFEKKPPAAQELKSEAPPEIVPEIKVPDEVLARTNILNEKLGMDITPEQVLKDFTKEGVEIVPFETGSGVSVKFNDGISAVVDKDGVVSFTSNENGPAVSPLMSDSTRESVYIEHINIKDMNINLLEEMKNAIPKRIEAENEILAALKKLSVVKARLYKLEWGIDLNENGLDKLLRQETIGRVLSGKWLNRFSAITEQAPKQITENIKNWFSLAGISPEEEEMKKPVAEILSKYATKIAEQIK